MLMTFHLLGQHCQVYLGQGLIDRKKVNNDVTSDPFKASGTFRDYFSLIANTPANKIPP